MIESVFIKLCPNCGGDITSERLELGLPCQKCLPNIGNLCENLKVKGDLYTLCDIGKETKNWEKIFEKGVKSKPWELQYAWFKRVLLGRSFALLAPTGIGKTSFGTSVAAYFAKQGKKSYIVVPTKMLLAQVESRILKFGVPKGYLLSFGEDTPKQKAQKMQKLESGDFRILLTTSMFLYKNYQSINTNFDFIFVDDVDSFLKTAKNVDKVLYLLGIPQEKIDTALEIINLRSKQKEENSHLIKELYQSLNNGLQKPKGVLVVSSATSAPKSNRVKLFRELLGFEVGTPTFYLRNVEDVYLQPKKLSVDLLVKLVKTLGKGGLVYVSSDLGKQEVEKIVSQLNKKGIKALSYEDISDEGLKLYEKGKVDLLVGIASYRNPLARGIDMPHVIRYAIFYGVPKIEVSLRFEENLSSMLWALTSIRSIVAKQIPQHQRKIENWIEKLKRYQYISQEYIQSNQDFQNYIRSMISEIKDFLLSEQVQELINKSEEVNLRKEGDEFYLVVSDTTGYLQASGRTSRMYAGGISKGLAITLVDDERAFRHLRKKIKWFSEDIEFKPLESVNLDEILKEIDKDREKIKRILKEEEKSQDRDILKPVLILVESPNKARTIANFFGKAIRRRIENHEVLETSMGDLYIMISASLGHVLDLEKNIEFHGVKVNGKIVPYYVPIEGKESIIRSIRLMSMEAKEVLIATDPDTEGEKIGWDLKELLKPYVKNIKRMEFHEVTKKAIIKSIKEPRDFNENLVKAQIVRRVADRWLGFEFSQLIQRSFGKNYLSAGRVQTPVLGWIIEREREYRKKVYKVYVKPKDTDLKVEFVFEDQKEAKGFYESLKYVNLQILEEREELKSPTPPYRTDTILKDASDKLRFSAQKTMDLLQDLFELGYITYHRTDYLRVSDVGMNLARQYIKEEHGESYVHTRPWGEEGAHESIRPTKAIDVEDLKSIVYSGQVQGLNSDHIKLYDLIFKRFMASQTRAVKVKIAKVKVKAFDKEQILEVPTKILQDGWNLFLPLETYKIKQGKLEVEKDLKQQPSKYLFTYGEIVQMMKEEGIGRPSTYASTIEKLIERSYVIERGGFLIPTKLGKMVYEYLQSLEDVKNYLSEEFTKHLELMMDMVEEGKEDYIQILKELYSNIIKIEEKKEVRL